MSDKTNSNPDDNRDIKEKAKAAASSASDEVKARAQDVADTVATEAANYADQAKTAAADEVKGVASALRTAAHEMRSGSPQERTFSQIAEGLADASDAMRDKDLSEMVGAVSDFAKRNPLVFLGSAALIGFAATRFAKASNDGASRSGGSGQYGNRMDKHAAGGQQQDSGVGKTSANRSSPGRTGTADVQSPAVATSREGNKV